MAPQGPRYQNPAEGFGHPNTQVGWPNKFFTFSFTIFGLVFLTYAGLNFGYKVFLNSKVADIRSELESLESQVTEEQKENLSTLYSQVANIRELVEDHSLTSKFMDSLEAMTSQSVSYVDFDIDMENREVAITGVASSYDALVSQLVLYEQSPDIESLTLEKAALDGSVVDFTLEMVVSEESFTTN